MSRDYYAEQARFCIASGVVQPSEYDQMSRIQINAWSEVIKEANKQ